MAERVGGIYYDVTLETGQMVDGQRKVKAELDKTTGALDGFSSKLSGVASAISVLAIAMATIKAAKMADDMRLMGARVEVAAGSVEAGASAMAALEAISKRTSTSVEANAAVFSRLNQSLIQMGGTQQDTLNMTELLGKAIKVSGASAVEAKSAMLQFGQAMGSGKLQGDELHSLMENAPYLMKKLADGIGVPVGALKKMGEEGKLTADVVANALNKAAGSIDADFKKFPQTIEGAMNVAMDAAARANSKLDDLTGTSAALTGVTKGVGEVFDELAIQFGAAADGSEKLGRNDKIKTWADATRIALSYVVDAFDGVSRAVEITGKWLGNVSALVVMNLKGEFAEAKAAGEEFNRDIEAILQKPLAGQKMRDQFNAGPRPAPDNTGFTPSKLKAPKDAAAEKKSAEEKKKLETRRLAAQEYYDGLVADNKTALEKIYAEEKKALTDNQKRQVSDGKNGEIYAKARVQIAAKYARERAILEEKTTQEVADLNISLTTDEVAKIELVRSESIRRADAAEKLGVMTHGEAERAKTLATFTATQQRAAISERITQTIAETNIAATTDELTKIDLARQESIRRADAAVKSGAITFAQGEADKARASVEAQNAIKDQVMSINPIAKLTQEYEQKLSIVRYYEQQMAQAGVDAAMFTEGKRAELATQFKAQRQALAESEFAMQSQGNKAVIDGLNSLASTATSSISGLITGTMSAQDAMKGLANVVLNSAVGALVEVGVQYLKNAIIGQTTAAAVASAQTAAIATTTTAQIAATAAVTTTSVAAAGTVAAAAAPAAGLMSIATLGQAALIGGAAIIGTMAIAKSFGGGRQYGGPVSAGSMYRVNETGAPEMFTASSGKQYMMPSKSGQVTAADKIGGGGDVQWSVIINNAPQGTTSSVDQSTRTVTVAVAEVANQIRSNSGPIWSALRGSTTTQSRL